MKFTKKYTVLTLLLSVVMFCGCAKLEDPIDINYWRSKLKTSESLSEDAIDNEKYLTDKTAEDTKYIYDILGSDEDKSNGFFSSLGLSLANQLKKWGKEGTISEYPENQTTVQKEVSVFQTTILEDASNTENGRIQVILERVVDGDTLMIMYQDMLLRVRLIGVNAPESVHIDETQNTPAGVDASNYLKELLADTEFLYLEFDSDPEDDYGRTLAYAWLNNEGTNIETDMLNGVIVKSGHAAVMTIDPNTKYSKELADINKKKSNP